MFEKLKDELSEIPKTMFNNDWSEIRRELALQDFQLMFLQSEQKKRREELDALKLQLEPLKQQLKDIKRDFEKRYAFYDLITSPKFIKRVDDPELRKKLRSLARIWKNNKPPKG